MYFVIVYLKYRYFYLNIKIFKKGFYFKNVIILIKCICKYYSI